MREASPVSAMCTTTVLRPTREPLRITNEKSVDCVSRDEAGSTLKPKCRSVPYGDATPK